MSRPKPLELPYHGHHPRAGTELVYEPVYGRLAPVAPDDLDKRGLEEWEKIWAAGFWLSHEMDYHWMAIIARAYDEIEAYRARVALDGLIQKGSMGQVVAHPLIQSIRAAEGTIMKALSILGFSPTDRARLGLSEAKRQSALAALRARK
jgi:P27 family predicted phage terminase small subunit